MGLFRFLLRLFATKSKTSSWPTHHTIPRVSRRERVVVLPKPAPTPVSGPILRGTCWVIDGDTIVIDKIHVRIAGIDAPELDHPWGQKSKWALVQLCKGQVVTAQIKPELSYDRVVAQCFLPDGRDIAAELVRLGMALDWPRFSGGMYKHLEPAGARKRHWRAVVRQGGRFPSEPSL